MSIKIGDILAGRYQILKILGQGGMADVYKALDSRLERMVAIKVIRFEQDSSPTLLKRFNQEAHSLGQLSHPNIVRILDFGEYAGEPYFVMGYMGGGSLKQFMLANPAIPWPVAVQKLLPISAALSYAHAHGVIHRDVKPDNILLTESGEPMLTDFGIARVLKGEENYGAPTTTLTSTGTVVGTPVYMSPEQALGQTVDGRSDIYSLGIVLYELVTGSTPFQGVTPMDILTKKITNSFPLPQQFNPTLPLSLVNVIKKALASEPDHRYQSMLEFTQALEACTNQQEAKNGFQNGFIQFIQSRVFLFSSLGLVGIALLFLFLSNIAGKKPDPTLTPAVAIVPSAELASQSDTPVDQAGPLADTPAPVLDLLTRSPISIRASLTPAGTPKKSKQLSVTPTAAIYLPLAGCARSRLHVGDWAFIDFGDTGNYIRKSADVHSSTNILGDASPGETMEIIGGPKCSYQWIMWEVVTAGGYHGWTPESDGTAFWLVPGSTWNACQGAPRSRLAIGGKAVVSKYPDTSNKVRADPSISGVQIGSILPGAVIQLLDKPACANNIVWWKVSIDNGQEGWTAEGTGSNYFLIPLLGQ